MRLTRTSLTGGLVALVAGAGALAPVTAIAMPAGVPSATATLVPAQNAGAHGVATYHHDLRSPAGQLSVRLSDLPPTASLRLNVVVHGDLVGQASVTTHGRAAANLILPPAVQYGWTVTVTTATGTVLVTGQLHPSIHLGNHRPSPSVGR
jgi:hypothetical protein